MSGVKIATVTDSISKLVISGVTLKDTDGIPEEVSERVCPIMFPDPDNFVTSLTVTPQSFGAGTSGKNDIRYTLNYVFLYAQVGSKRYLSDYIVGLVSMTVLILNSIIANDSVTGSVDIAPRIAGNFGQMQDPAGNMFFGVMISVDVREFYEV